MPALSGDITAVVQSSGSAGTVSKRNRDMITIGSDKLIAKLIDPHRDRGKLGPRYCNGGYIWQIYGKNGRPLLAGPRYPSKTPPVFDGQGMPEAFKIPELVQPCLWEVSRGDDFAVMMTTQKSIKLRREVRVSGNRVESATTVENISDNDVPIRWFSHPFFPLNPNLTCGKINQPATLPENAGYDMDDDGMIRMKPDYPWEKGLFQPIDVPPKKLTFTIPHPAVGQVILSTDYDVIYCPIWANANTFSFEPFVERLIKPKEKTSWSIALTV